MKKLPTSAAGFMSCNAVEVDPAGHSVLTSLRKSCLVTEDSGFT